MSERKAWAHVKQHTDGRWGVSLYHQPSPDTVHCMGTIALYPTWHRAYDVAYQWVGQLRWVSS